MTTSDEFGRSADGQRRESGAQRKTTSIPFSRSGAALIITAVLAFGGIAMLPRWLDINDILRRSSTPEDPSPLPLSIAADDRAQSERFFRQQAVPILQDTARKNRDAIARALDTLGDSIDKYRTGIDPFIADLRSWSTTYHIFLKSVVGWWRGDESLANYVDGRFRRHIFTDETIAANVRNALVELDADLETNRNQLLVNLRNASASSQMAALPRWPTREEFSGGVSRPALAAMELSARASVVSNVLASAAVDAPTAAFLPAVAAGAAKAAAIAAMRAAATTAGETVLAEGGVVVADAGSGGALGSEVPVIGNAVGFCAGLVVSAVALHYEGIVEDEKLRQDLDGFIDGLKTALVGDGRTQSDLANAMTGYVREVDRGEEDLVKQAVMEAGKEP